MSLRSAAEKDCPGEVNLEKNILPEDLIVFFFEVLFLRGGGLGMMLEDDSLLLLGCNCRAWHTFSICLSRRSLCHLCTTTSRGLLVVGPDMDKLLAVVTLYKASFSNM